MCGIFCALSRHEHVWPTSSVVQLLGARGPDASGQLALTTSNFEQVRSEPGADPGYSVFVSLFSTVLSLRGPVTIHQPYSDPKRKSALCWNGEAWSIRGNQTFGNDTIAVWQLLHQTLEKETSLNTEDGPASMRASSLSRVLSQIAGPYAFIFYDETTSTVYFGRDFLGRRSLVRKVGERGDLIFSSITDGESNGSWTEIEADGLYFIQLRQDASFSRSSTYEHELWGDYAVGKVAYTTSRERGRNESYVGQPLPFDFLGSWRAHPAKMAILFSGGLDCTVLARLAHELLPASETIDLLNVAFENPRIHKPIENEQDSNASFEACPDRTTGRASHHELCRVCPGRKWRFIAINVPYTESQQHRAKIIRLMHPHNTEMDLSIAYALCFAARGVGLLSCGPEKRDIQYTTSARVLLSGLGADELFAGYMRHATAFKRNGFVGLLDELELDVSRLGKRNLGRDDRVITNWGKEARFPYLDESLVSWAMEAPVTEKCGFGEAQNETGIESDNSTSMLEPDKKVLRCLAWKLAMKSVAKEKKRAIQFGARTAKMEAKKTKGTQQLT